MSSTLVSNFERKPCLAISGPTASGKSWVAVELAKQVNAEIINADSVQLYKEFLIGSGSVSYTHLTLPTKA